MAETTRTSPASEPASSLGRYQQVVHAAIKESATSRLGERIRTRDASVWSRDPAVQATIANRLGWLGVVTPMREAIGEMTDFAAGVRADGYRHAVLLGMGGSSLCPEVLAKTFGPAPDAPDLIVLDNTAPEAIRAVEETIDLARTLFLVSTKSGTTIETLSFARYFEDRVRRAGLSHPERHFAAITDPGTPLEAEARRVGYRHVFLNPPDIGGRYSALSYFGLVPAAILGIDLDLFLASAAREAYPADETLAAAQLGVTLGTLARHGCDKVTLVLPAPLASFGTWAEQLLAESTGKDGTGLIPVDAEPLGAPSSYGADRVFVQLRLATVPDDEADRALDALAAAGHPVLRRTIASAYEIAGEFFRWEAATATAGAILGVNPFDEPNVTEAKDTTREVLAEVAREGHLPRTAPVVSGGGLEIHTDADTAARLAAAIAERAHPIVGRDDPAAWLRAFFDAGEASADGDYVALLAYMRQTPTRDAAFTRARLAARDRWRRATTLGYGPRYLHSTGQLHKGGPNSGLFVQITSVEYEDVPIPDERYTFGVLRDAQAVGDLIVLRRRGRRAIRVHLTEGPDTGIFSFADALERAAGV
jgi:glucose-6-phosphate isomerase